MGKLTYFIIIIQYSLNLSAINVFFVSISVSTRACHVLHARESWVRFPDRESRTQVGSFLCCRNLCLALISLKVIGLTCPMGLQWGASRSIIWSPVLTQYQLCECCHSLLEGCPPLNRAERCVRPKHASCGLFLANWSTSATQKFTCNPAHNGGKERANTYEHSLRTTQRSRRSWPANIRLEPPLKKIVFKAVQPKLRTVLKAMTKER